MDKWLKKNVIEETVDDPEETQISIPSSSFTEDNLTRDRVNDDQNIQSEPVNQVKKKKS